MWPRTGLDRSSTTYNGKPFVVSTRPVLLRSSQTIPTRWGSPTAGSNRGRRRELDHRRPVVRVHSRATQSKRPRLDGPRTLLGDSFGSRREQRAPLMATARSRSSPPAWALKRTVSRRQLTSDTGERRNRDDGAANLRLYWATWRISTRPSKTKPQAVFVDKCLGVDSRHRLRCPERRRRRVARSRSLRSRIPPRQTTRQWYAGAAAVGKPYGDVFVGLTGPRCSAGRPQGWITLTFPPQTAAGDTGGRSSSLREPLADSSFSLSGSSSTKQVSGGPVERKRSGAELRQGRQRRLAIDFSCAGAHRLRRRGFDASSSQRHRAEPSSSSRRDAYMGQRRND